MNRSSLAILLPLVALACDSGNDQGTPTPDTSADSAADTAVDTGGDDTAADTQAEDTSATEDTAADTAAPEDTTPADTTPGDTVTGACNRTGFVQAQASFSSGQGTTIVQLRSEGSPFEMLAIEIYTNAPYEGALDVGTYPLDGSNYETCSNCVRMRGDCAGQTCDKVFMVDEGDLVITQWDFTGGHFSGRLEGAKAHEVTIDSETYVSTLVPGGETWCLDGVEFDAEIAALPVSDRTQPQCVNAGTGNILHDNVANIQLTNCAGRRVKLHSTCDDPTQKALWLIGTTGWCTACHEFISNYVDQHGGSLSRAIVGDYTPGLDMLIVLGEDNYGQKPTQAYCKAYAEELGLDPNMVLIDWSDDPMPINVVNAPGAQVETNSLGTLWTAMDPYLYAESDGSVATYYPWWALLRPRNMEYVWSDRAAPQSFEVTVLNLLAE